MIVNVNPYDTGYDENSHVMRFAALAREVYTTPAAAPHKRPPPKINRPPLKDPDIVPLPFVKRKVTVSIPTGDGRKMSEACLEVVEEDEDTPMKDVDEADMSTDGEGINPLVNSLFDEIEVLRRKVRAFGSISLSIALNLKC